MHARAAFALLPVFLFALLACGGKPASSLPVSQTQSGPLGAAPASAPSPTKTGPLEVTYFAPQGETEGQIEISVSFDRPMVALGAETAATEGVLTIEPPVPGRARWVGSQTLLFEPSSPLPQATEYRVRVARGVRALDGQTLAEDLTFAFATPALALVSERKASENEPYLQRRWVDLYFNQPVAPARLAEFVELAVQTGKKPETSADFTVERPDPLDLRRLRVLAKAPFPLSSQVSVRVRAGLTGVEGPRALAQDAEQRLRIYGPLRIVPAAPCRGEDCTPRLVFSNPVRMREAYGRLRFEPPLSKPMVRDYDYETSELYFGAELAPDTTYRVHVEGELKDIYGTPLEGARVAVVRTPPLVPLAHLLVEGDLVHASKVPALRVSLQNLKDARLDLYPLSAEEVFPDAIENQRPRAAPLSHPLGSAGSTERRVAALDPSAALPGGKGIVLASLVARGKGAELRERRLLAFTDLAPSLKTGAHGGVLWLTRFSDARPVADARVRIVRAQETLATGKTDDKGLFAFTLPASAPRAESEESDDDRDLSAVVEKDGDVSFTHKFAGVGPWELTSHASYSGGGATSAHLFTERGIYRPGDTLQLKGILRTHGAAGIVPSAGEVSLRVVDASDSEVERASVKLGPYGSFAHSVRIPGSVELGPLFLHVQHAGQSFSLSAEVAEYRPAELEVSLHSDRELVVRGERVAARVAGHYLFGAPAKEAGMFWSARYLPRNFQPASYPGFVFEDEDDDAARDHPYDVAASGEGKLDARGELRIEAELSGAPLNGPSSLEIETSVVSHGAQAASSTRIDVVPANILVGLRAETALGEVHKPLAVELVALTPSAEPRADVALDTTLVRRVFTSELVDGRVVYKPKDQLVGSCRPKSKVERTRCSFTPTEPGLHIARVRAKDRQGRPSTAASFVYVYGTGEASWGGDEQNHVFALKSDRARFALGETARLLVPSPWPDAEALVTVEREGVMSVERMRVGPANTLDVRIDERFVPNAFVSVLLVRPLGAETPDAAQGPPYRVGALELAADVSARKLAVELRPDQTEKRPGDELRVELAVRDGNGKPTQAELTVFAVDEGVLALTGYRTPDPFAAIYAPRPLSVWTSDARGSLARLLAGADDEKGGDEGGGGGRMVRSNFAAVALYVPSLETDAEGRASLRFKLPDSTTRYRIMAVAASRGAEVGAGATSVRTQKPLMLRPLLPRVLRAGDQLSAGVVVHNEQDRAVEVEVALEAANLTLRDTSQKRVQIAAKSAREVRFVLQAEQVGQASLKFSAKAGDERDALELARSVLSPSVVQTVSLAGSTEAEAREALAPLPNVRRDVGGLSLALSTSALAGLESPARSLLAYEYGCTEQLSSRLMALSALERLRKPLALSDPPFGPQAAQLSAELERHQRGDGGFGLWAPNDATPPALSTYLSAYALIALTELASAGLPVSPHAQERTLKYLASVLREPPPAGQDARAAAERLSLRAFVVYALARSGHHDAGYANKLFEQRAELPAWARIELMYALAQDAQGKERAAVVWNELSSHVRVTADEAHLETNAGDAYAPAFVSDVRASSELLLALLGQAPEHPLLPKLARWLAGARGRDGSFRGTHESAWGLTALAAYGAAREPSSPTMRATATLGDRVLGSAALSGARAKSSLELAMRDLPVTGERLSLTKQGSGTLHYAVRLSYAQSELPTAPSERGFFVERSYERIAPTALASGATQGELADSAEIGDYVRITLRLAVPSARRFVLITDPLPAGLEPVDLGLATELQGAARALSNAAPLDHQELRDDRAVFAINELPPGLYRYTYLARASTAGQFVSPPAKVEEMYHPETEGRSSAQSFTVKAP